MLMSLVVFGGQAYSVQRKVTLAATTVANIFAQANNVNTSTITVAELNQILSYPNLVLYPYDGNRAAVVVSQLLVTSPRTGPRPARSAAAGRTPTEQRARRARNCRSILDRLRLFRLGRQYNNYVVLGEVSYPFQATGIYFSVGTSICMTKSS